MIEGFIFLLHFLLSFILSLLSMIRLFFLFLSIFLNFFPFRFSLRLFRFLSSFLFHFIINIIIIQIDERSSLSLCWLPLFHDMGLVGNVFSVMHFGMPAILMSPMSFLKRPELFMTLLSDLKVPLSYLFLFYIYFLLFLVLIINYYCSGYSCVGAQFRLRVLHSKDPWFCFIFSQLWSHSGMTHIITIKNTINNYYCRLPWMHQNQFLQVLWKDFVINSDPTDFHSKSSSPVMDLLR